MKAFSATRFNLKQTTDELYDHDEVLQTIYEEGEAAYLEFVEIQKRLEAATRW